MGEKHTFSIESAYGIHDERVRQILVAAVSADAELGRRSDDFMDGIMRGNSRDPGLVEARVRAVAARTGDRHDAREDEGLGRHVARERHLARPGIHGIEGIGYQPLPTDKVRAYFDYIKALEGRLWVATFQDGAKYMRERMRSTVTTKQAGGDRGHRTHALDRSCTICR